MRPRPSSADQTAVTAVLMSMLGTPLGANHPRDPPTRAEVATVKSLQPLAHLGIRARCCRPFEDQGPSLLSILRK